MTSDTEKTKDILAIARTEIDRLLTLTSEQATEIVRARSDNDAATLAFAEGLALAKSQIERQSVLLKKAETALEAIARTDKGLMALSAIEDAHSECIRIARAVLSELQLKDETANANPLPRS